MILHFVDIAVPKLINNHFILFFLLILFFFNLELVHANEIQNWDDSIEETKKETFQVETYVDGFDIPWGMTFLPNKNLIISDKNGDLWEINYENKKKTQIIGAPKVKYKGQGGLLDVQVHPDFINNNYIYIGFTDFLKNKKNKTFTSIIRARLEKNTLINHKYIYKADDRYYTSRTLHYGTRIVFDQEGHLYFSIGDRGNRDQAQLLNYPNGKIHRLNDDGSIPKDNPFIKHNNAIKSIWTYGNRNPQGLAIHPVSSIIFETEHGPKGGDELNILFSGKNYGWPEITYGINYSGTPITDKTEDPSMAQPIYYWVPSIAPSGMAFSTSNIYKEWKGSLFIGSLKFEYLERLVIENNKVVKREKVLDKIGRVRNVIEGPDGYLYIGVEGKGIIKIIPKT